MGLRLAPAAAAGRNPTSSESRGSMAEMSSRRQVTGNARLREALVGYGFVLIPMAVFLTFFIYPFFYALYISRFDWGVFGKIETLGLENYRTLLHDELFWRAVKNT